jgi:hypothetical protein
MRHLNGQHMKIATILVALALGSQLAGQAPIDTSKIGPQVGTAAPAFSGPDQDGVTRSLASVAGRKGTMLVFFRSADW